MDITSEQCIEKIVEYVKGVALIDPSQQIPLDQSLLEAGILDSFGIVELLTFVESEFDLPIPDEDVTKENMGSIRKMAHYICQKKMEN